MNRPDLDSYELESRAIKLKYGKGIIGDAINRLLNVIAYARDLEQQLQACNIMHGDEITESRHRIQELQTAIEPAETATELYARLLTEGNKLLIDLWLAPDVPEPQPQVGERVLRGKS